MKASNRSGQSAVSAKGWQQGVRLHPLFFFFFLTYVFSWVLLTPSVLAAWGILQGDFVITFVLHTFGPARR